jgi:hypothetical protein
MSEYHDAVGDALESWVHGLPPDEGVSGEGDIGMIGDWIAIVSMVRVNEDGIPVTEYYMCMKDGTLLPHMALGLLSVGNHLIANQTAELN